MLTFLALHSSNIAEAMLVLKKLQPLGDVYINRMFIAVFTKGILSQINLTHIVTPCLFQIHFISRTTSRISLYVPCGFPIHIL